MLALLVNACTSASDEEQTLKKAFEGKFFIGAALNGAQIQQTDSAAIEVIKKQFNTITAENCMKSGPIQPVEGEFNFDLPDKFVELGLENDMYILGHCLVWHSQAPRWFFTDAEGKDVSRELLIERMKTHISTVVGRYKGKVDAWDVVNEAILDDGTWRNSKFYEIIGPDFIKLAFQFAHEADPEAELLYNDYSMFHEGKRNSVVALVNDLKKEGVQIDGVGMQAHYGLDNLPLEEFEKSIIAFAETGVQVHITELDISVLPFPDWRVGAEVSANFEYQKKMNPYAEGLSDSANIAFEESYINFFKVLLKHKESIRRVTTWGVADHNSWKNGWPMRGRTDYPLLFDREYKAKPVVQKLIEEAGNTE
jgi:endo-1,4-beta-xylanase